MEKQTTQNIENVAYNTEAILKLCKIIQKMQDNDILLAKEINKIEEILNGTKD